MDQVEVVCTRGVVQCHRQGEGIRRMLEERIVLHLYFVEEDSFVQMLEAERLIV
jgi:hypothetical protein